MEIGAPPLVVGRLPGPGGLAIEDSKLSRRHVAAWVDPEGVLWCEDLGSRNGTSLDRVPLEGRRQVWGDDGLLYCGQTLLHVGYDVTPAETWRSTLDPLLMEAIAAHAKGQEPLGVLAAPGAGLRTLARELHRRSGRGGPLVLLGPGEWPCDRAEDAAPVTPGATLLLDGADGLGVDAASRVAARIAERGGRVIFAARSRWGRIRQHVAKEHLVRLPHLEKRRATVWLVTQTWLRKARAPRLTLGAIAVWLAAPLPGGWADVEARAVALGERFEHLDEVRSQHVRQVIPFEAG